MANLPPKRGLVFLALTILCVMWMLIAFGTNVFKIDGNNGAEAYGDIWYTCNRGVNAADGSRSIASCRYNTDPGNTCTKYKDRVRSIQAFYILTAVFVVLNLTFGVMDHFGKLESLPFGAKSQLVLVVLAAIVIVWSMLSWAIAISYPRTEYCGGGKLSDTNNFKWGASPFMMLMLFITAIVQLVLALIFPGGAGGVAASEHGGGESADKH